MCSGPPLFCGEEVGGGGRWGRLEGEGGPLFGPGVEGTGSRSNFPGFGRTFQRLCAPAWGPGPVGLAGEGGGAVLGPSGGAVTAESGPRFVPVREGATVVWTVAAGRALSGPCWRAVCRSGTDSEGRQNRLWARVFPCNGERGCTAGRGGTLAGARVSLQRGEGVYGWRGGACLRVCVFPCNGEGGCAVGQGGPVCGHACSPCFAALRGGRMDNAYPLAPPRSVGAVSRWPCPPLTRRLSPRTEERAEICAGICRQPIAIAGQFLYH